MGLRAQAGVNGREAHTEATGESKRIANMQMLGFCEHPLFDFAASLPQRSREGASSSPAKAALKTAAVPCCVALFFQTRDIKLRANSCRVASCAVAAVPLVADSIPALRQRTAAGN